MKKLSLIFMTLFICNATFAKPICGRSNKSQEQADKNAKANGASEIKRRYSESYEGNSCEQLSSWEQGVCYNNGLNKKVTVTWWTACEY